MFLTFPQFEQQQMTALALRGQRYWRMVVAPFAGQPWYLFTYVGQAFDRRVELTQLLSWEQDLLEAVSLIPVSERRHIYRVSPTKLGELALQLVRGLWEPTPEEQADGICAVLSFADSSNLVDDHLRPVSSQSTRREVFQLNRPGIPGVNRPGIPGDSLV